MTKLKACWLLMSFSLLFGCDHPSTTESPIQIIYKDIDSTKDIEPLDAQAVQPVAYTHVVSLAELPVAEKKQKFADLLVPAILISRQKLADTHARLSQLAEKQTNLSDQDQAWLDGLYKKYRAKTIDDLLLKTLTHPNSITLAQAALETGWGTSRFFTQGNNIFGVWSFNENEPRIAASEAREGNKTVYVKSYPSLIDSIDDYFLTLARNDAYKTFRAKRANTQDPMVLVQELGNYSEIGDEYIRRLTGIMNFNKLPQFDSYQLAQAQ